MLLTLRKPTNLKVLVTASLTKIFARSPLFPSRIFALLTFNQQCEPQPKISVANLTSVTMLTF